MVNGVNADAALASPIWACYTALMMYNAILARPGGNQPIPPEDLLGRKWGEMSHAPAAVDANTNAVVAQTK